MTPGGRRNRLDVTASALWAEFAVTLVRSSGSDHFRRRRSYATADRRSTGVDSANDAMRVRSLGRKLRVATIVETISVDARAIDYYVRRLQRTLKR